ncbi:UNVERIFIED_ORG: hypothetical protein J2Y78_003780 [Buttiauxella agrestis ATCC 33320]
MSQWFYCVEIMEKGVLAKDSGILSSNIIAEYDDPKAALDAILWQFKMHHPDAEITIVNLNKV